MVDPPPPYEVSQQQRQLLSGRLTLLPDYFIYHCLSLLTSWTLAADVRLVCQRLRLAAEVILRDRHIGLYVSLVRHPYSTQALTARSCGDSCAEMKALHLFAVTCARSVWLAGESNLHLFVDSVCKNSIDVPDWLEDIFARMQPALRLQDLLAEKLARDSRTVLRGQDITIQFRQKHAVLMLPFESANHAGATFQKEILTVPKSHSTTLEELAAQLMAASEKIVFIRNAIRGTVVYQVMK